MTHERSTSSAGAVFLEPEARLAELRAMAERAARRMPSIRRVLLFGSLAKREATARSDADLLVEVRTSPHRLPRDRVPEVLAAMRPISCPLDLFVFTSAELAEPRGVAKVALIEGVDLLRAQGD